MTRNGTPPHSLSFRITYLHLENCRGIRALDLELDPRLNVFVGVNGSGKTTVLFAIATLLMRLLYQLTPTSSDGFYFSPSDVSNGSNEDLLVRIAVAAYDKSFWWEIVQRQQHTTTGELSLLASHIAESFRKDSRSSVPVFVFYSVQRVVTGISLEIPEKETDPGQRSTYENSLGSYGTQFQTLFSWYREMEDLENERRLNGDLEHRDFMLEGVRRAIERLTGFDSLRVSRSPLRLTARKNGENLDIQQLSDGEKCLLAMVGDLARRLALANPGLVDPLQGGGVVLIDEIELHLHPQWQQMVLPRLLEVFPNCQFMVTTHSPLIVTEVPHKSLFLSENGTDGITFHRVDNPYGQSAERILEDYFGLKSTRPPHIAEALDRLYDSISQGELATAKREISRLREEIGPDPDLVKADVLIARKEAIGR